MGKLDKIRKYAAPFAPISYLDSDEEKRRKLKLIEEQAFEDEDLANEQREAAFMGSVPNPNSVFNQLQGQALSTDISGDIDGGLQSAQEAALTQAEQTKKDASRQLMKDQFKSRLASSFAGQGNYGSKIADGIKSGNGWGIAGAAAQAGINAAGQYALQGKNFNEASAAGDEFANAASDLAQNFGPWGQVAAAGIQAVNLADKMGGKTVPGFQVPITSSGFGNSLKKSQDQSLRLSQMGMLDRTLGRRNQQAELALQAAQVDKDESFQLKARMASTEDVLNRNRMALAGGYDSETLGA